MNIPAVVCAFLLLACGGADTPDAGPTPSPSRVPPVVVALGDSLTAGPGLRESETFPAVLQARARVAGYDHVFHNAGVSGDTSEDALQRFDRAVVPNARIMIVAIGANDGLRGVPVSRVRANVSEIVRRAQERGLRVLLCGMETPPTRGLRYSLDFHNIFPDLAAQFQVPLMPFLLTGVVGDANYNLEDGVHPNAEGARRIADNMWPYLEPLLRATAG